MDMWASISPSRHYGVALAGALVKIEKAPNGWPWVARRETDGRWGPLLQTPTVMWDRPIAPGSTGP
jgi:hypothetical protein